MTGRGPRLPIPKSFAPAPPAASMSASSSAWLAASLLAAAGLWAALSPLPARAGAWTAAPGTGFLSTVVAPDPDGPTGLRRDRYFEQAAAEGVTIGFNSNQVLSASEPDDFMGRVEGFLRARLFQSDAGDVVSLQGEIGGGVMKADDGADATLRLLWGRGFGSALGPAWTEAGLGWRLETDAAEADRALIAAAFGVRPAPGWLALMAAEADLDGERTGSAWEAARITFTVAREIRSGDSLSLQVETTPWSRRVTDGVQLRLGLWRAF